MYVGIAKLTVVIPDSHSLKEKRMVIRRVKDRVRERLGVVLNEVGELESWQRAELGCAVVSGERQKALELVDEVVRVVQSASGGQLVGVARDAWTYDVAPAPISLVDDRTGSGDKAIASDDWVPDAWRDDREPE
ncbi:MAG: hypothetical protein H6Q90_4630 [Deltaproteobacteria bacterium]|nr:hypothetical protein [Deltaproteobacteria bacterium]